MSEYVPETRQVRIAYSIIDGNVTDALIEERGRAFDRWLVQHDRQVKAEALREYADLVEEIANLGANNTGLRTPHHLAEYTRNYANRIESQETP